MLRHISWQGLRLIRPLMKGLPANVYPFLVTYFFLLEYLIIDLAADDKLNIKLHYKISSLNGIKYIFKCPCISFKVYAN